MEKPTEKQLKYIESIELNMGIIFTGKTKEDAYRYISANNLSFFRVNHAHPLVKWRGLMDFILEIKTR